VAAGSIFGLVVVVVVVMLVVVIALRTRKAHYFPPNSAAQPAKTNQQPTTSQIVESSSSATTSTSSKARAAFEKLTVEELIQYLKLDDKKQSVFREQEIDGQALTKLSTQDLVSIGVPLVRKDIWVIFFSMRSGFGEAMSGCKGARAKEKKKNGILRIIWVSLNLHDLPNKLAFRA